MTASLQSSLFCLVVYINGNLPIGFEHRNRDDLLRAVKVIYNVITLDILEAKELPLSFDIGEFYKDLASEIWIHIEEVEMFVEEMREWKTDKEQFMI